MPSKPRKRASDEPDDADIEVIEHGTVRGVRLRHTAVSKDFVDSSRALGNSHLDTLIRHVLPNCIAPVSVIGTSLFATALLSESALAFLGLGVPPPHPTWGGMLADTKQFASTAVWLVLAPGLAISTTLLAVNLLGDALRDFFDPRMEQI